MNKKIVVGIIAGVGVVAGVLSLVITSVKRLKVARAFYEEAGELYDEARDMLYEADDIFEDILDYADDEDEETELQEGDE